MIYVIASIKVKASCQDKFLVLFKANVGQVLREEGCLEYAPTVDFKTDLDIQQLDSTTVTILEKWESIDHLHAHFVAPHMQAYKSDVADLVESVSLKILEGA